MSTDSQSAAPGAGRPASAVAGVTVHRQIRAYTVLQLRMLVRNEQQRVDEMKALMDSMEVTDLTPAWLYRCEQVSAQLQHYQRLLAVHLDLQAHTDAACSQPGAGRPASAVAGLNPAAPSQESAPALVTTEAARPGNSLA